MVERTEPDRSQPARQTPGALTSSYYRDVYRASPTDRIKMIRDRLRATDAEIILAGLSLPREMTFTALKLSVISVNEEAQKDDALSQAESERLLGIAKMIGQLQTMIDESGDPEGLRPFDLLDTMEGQALISETLARMQSGA